MNFLRNLIQGTQSASKTDSGQKKKGAPPPPGPGGPEDVQNREDPSASTQAAVCVTQPSSPALPPANLPSPSLTKESETASATEETSFASCLTEEASALSECCVLPPQDVTPASEASRAPGGAHQADSVVNSVSDSVALNIAQNGVKKDSEYESAEELESPSGTTAVIEEPSSASANVATNQAQSANQGPDEPVPIREEKGVEEKDETRKTEVGEEPGSQVIPGTVNGHSESDPKVLGDTISDSVVTITKSEIIEESIQVLPEVNKNLTSEPKSLQGESRIVTSETVETNGNLSEVHARLSTTVELQQQESKINGNVCNGDQICLEEITSNQSVCDLVNDDLSNSSQKEKPVEEIINTEPVEVNSSELPLPPVRSEDPEEIPIVPKKAYNLDFLDNLDDPNFNPFASKSAVRNTPPPSPEPGRKPLKPAIRKKKQSAENAKPKITETESPLNTVNGQQEQNQDSREESKKLDVSKEQETAVAVKGNESEDTDKKQILEIAFDDTPVAVRKPPRTLGKRPQPKPKVKKPVEKNNNTVVDSNVHEPDVKPEPEEEIPIPPSKGYNLDFLDNLDDPSFNPFQTKTTVSNSPPKEGFVAPSDKAEKDIKPKPKVVTPKKSPVKKGFSVIKNKKSPNKPEDQVDSPKESPISAPAKETEVGEEPVEVPKKGYNLDFLDDPNFDPFQTRTPNQNLSPEDKSKEDIKTPEEVTEKDSPKENKPTEVLEEVQRQQEQRLGAEGSEDPSVSVANQSQNEKESGELQETLRESKEVEDKAAEVEQESTSSQPLETNTLVTDTKLVEDKLHNCEATEVQVVEEHTKVEVKPQVAVVKPQVAEVKPLVAEVKPLIQEDLKADKETSLRKEENSLSEDSSCDKSDVTASKTTDIVASSEKSKEEAVPSGNQQEAESGLQESSIPKVPSIGRIGQLDSLEFAQLLGNEASRLAEEFMNCSSDSGLPDSDDSSSVKLASSTTNMDHSKAAHLDENVNPFLKNSRLARSPPLGKRGAVCGAESADTSEVMDPFKPRRSLRREEVLGEDRQDTASVDDDSGIVIPTRADLEAEVNHSEAGPEIATGLTSSDLRCASQLRTEDPEEDLCDQITDEEFLASEAFFKEASEMERQFRRNLSTPMGSQSKLSGDEVTPIKEKPEQQPSVTPESPQNKPVPSTSTPIPPREERSAPEGTSSPTPRPSDTSEHKPSSSRPLSVPADGYVTTAEVEELLKRQSLQFEEKLLRAELAAGEKERKLIQAMKEDQKDKGSVAELAQSRDALLKMVGQYKGMLAQLVAEKEKDKQGAEERIKTIETERNQALDDLANVENAFSDVHRKYERTKQVVDTLKRNEETLRGAISDYEVKLQKQEQKFVEFQKHAEEKIQLANEEFETMRKANEQEMTKMAALLKKAEMKIVSLQDAFDRKTRENQELTQLCDDLINKVGGTN